MKRFITKFMTPILNFAIIAAISAPVLGQERAEQIPTRPIIDEIRAHSEGIAVWWTGHNGWLIKSGTTLMSTDLILGSEERRKYAPPVTAQELAPELDIAFITHEHGDHFERATSRILAEQSDCLFVIPSNCVEVAHNIGIPDERIKVAVPRKAFAIGEISVEPMRAIHGNPRFAVYTGANFEDCGYLIKAGGVSFLQMGDTVLLEDHLYLEHVDVLFFSPTEHNTYIDQSIILINELEPYYIFPQHRNTLVVTPENRYFTTGYPYEVKFRLAKYLQERYYILDFGEKVLINLQKE